MNKYPGEQLEACAELKNAPRFWPSGALETWRDLKAGFVRAVNAFDEAYTMPI